MKLALVMLALALLSVSAATDCAGSVSQYVPAVVGEGGGLVNVTVSLAPGDGMTFAGVEPRTGTMTQESIGAAVSYAHALAGIPQGCDVLVGFDAPRGATYVEGPSAGAALTVMTYALLENRTMRNDTIITGTIDEFGDVGAVGGLYEKARGAAQMGARYFITPVESFYEALLLKDVESEYGITVFQAMDVEEVIGFMLDNRSLERQGITAEKRPVPSLAPYDTSGMEGFAAVSQHMIDLENSALQKMPQEDNETEAISEFYANEVERQGALLRQGYLFGAANEAFLNYIDISTIDVILAGDPDLPRKKGELGICLSSLARPDMTDGNFEWIIGRDLREEWAQDKLDNTDIGGELLAEEEYTQYNSLMYGQAWCQVGKELVAEAPSGGTRLDESAWKRAAERELAAARSLDITDADLQSRLALAEDSYMKGRYGAAIYDAAYVSSMAEASLATNITAELDALLAEHRTSLWGRVYQSQGALLRSENDSVSAYRIARFAEALDSVTEEMRSLAAEAQGGTAGATGGQPADAAVSGTIAAIIIFLLLGLIIVKWRSDGDKRARAGKTAGAKQKKGRA